MITQGDAHTPMTDYFVSHARNDERQRGDRC